MKTPKLTTKQLTLLAWLSTDTWCTEKDYSSYFSEQKVFDELHTLGLVEKRSNGVKDEFRKRTQKEIIEHYQNKK